MIDINRAAGTALSIFIFLKTESAGKFSLPFIASLNSSTQCFLSANMESVGSFARCPTNPRFFAAQVKLNALNVMSVTKRQTETNVFFISVWLIDKQFAFKFIDSADLSNPAKWYIFALKLLKLPISEL